ncbi:MAG: peptidoglycan-binding protein, partial [Comamonadaceae bacterium]
MDTVSDAFRESFDPLGLELPFATGAERAARDERGGFPAAGGEDFSPFAEGEEGDSDVAIEPRGEMEVEMEVEEAAPWAGAEMQEEEEELPPDAAPWTEAEELTDAGLAEEAWTSEASGEDESLVWLDLGAGEDDGAVHEEAAVQDQEQVAAPEIVTLRTLLESEAGAGTGLADRVKGAAELALGPGLGLGTRGAAVASLQRALAGLGHDLAVDGEFGANTERVVCAFQRESGLEPDGIVDARTKTAIAQAMSAPARIAAADGEYDAPAGEQALAGPARVQASSVPVAAGPLNFQVIDAAGKPLAQARWALEQEGAVVEGALDANGGTGALHPALRRFDRTRPFRIHIEGHVCSIVRGAMLLAGEPEVEYGGQFVDWSLADAADARQRDAFWKEYEQARKLRAPGDVFRFLQHDHVMRRPIKLLARGSQVVFQAHPVAIRLGPLVRYVDAGRALVWVELETPGLVRVLYAKAGAQQELPPYTDTPAATQSRHAGTVRVGGRHYALVWLDALEPDTAYQYTLELGPMPMSGSLPVAQADFTEAVFPRSVPRGVAHATATSLALRSFGNNTRWLFFRTLP